MSLEEQRDMTLESLKVLEGKVENVLAQQQVLGQERDRLRDELKAAQDKIAAMTGQLEEIERERLEVRTRVDSLLGRLDELSV